MRILKKDLKAHTHLRIESLDDLWHLENIIRQGDLIRARTVRTLQNTDDKQKRPVTLTISVEKAEFREDSSSLRIMGKIMEGPDDINHGYHSITLGEGDSFWITKDWKNYEIDRLEKSARSEGISVLLCLVDEHKANFYIVRETRIEELGEKTGEGTCKVYKDHDNRRYYEEVASTIHSYADRFGHMIIAGPGFTKDTIMSYLDDDRLKDSKIITEGASNTGMSGANEIIRRGAIKRMIKESFISKETALVDEFLKELGKESGYAVYGDRECEEAIMAGSLKKFLVSDTRAREEHLQEIMTTAEKHGTEIHLISTSHDAGIQLSNLGGIAGITRYPFSST